MFRLWARIFQDNHMLQDTVICDERNETRTHKVFDALEAVCYQFDLSKPILQILKSMTRLVLRRTILWRISVLTIWKSM